MEKSLTPVLNLLPQKESLFCHDSRAEPQLPPFAINQIGLYEELEKELRNVVSWRKEELIAKTGFENPWANYTKEKWQKLFPEYPLPDL